MKVTIESEDLAQLIIAGLDACSIENIPLQEALQRVSVALAAVALPKVREQCQSLVAEADISLKRMRSPDN